MTTSTIVGIIITIIPVGLIVAVVILRGKKLFD
jgi:hypothetical protein